MNCQDIARILDGQEVDSLLAEEQTGVQEHLSTCTECARDWQIHARLTSAAIPAVPAVLRAQFSPQRVAASSSGGRRRNGLFVIGALVALAAAAATLLVHKQQPAPPAVAIRDSTLRELSATQARSEARPSSVRPVPDANSKADEVVDEWISRVTAWLAARDDADALLTAAILASSDSGPPPQEALSLLKRATAKAPDNARIQATAMQLCFTSKLCDATPYEQALRRIAPDNALGWELDAVRASRADDQQALLNALARMSGAKTYDLYENSGLAAFVSRLREALVPPPRFDGSSPAFSRDEFAIAVFEDELPKLRNDVIQKLCKSSTDEKVLAECHQVGAAMRAGDSITTNLAGIAISGYGLPADSAEARSLAQEERQLHWSYEAFWEAITLPEDTSLWVQYPHLLEMMADHPRGKDMWRAMLEENGIPTEPPADWKCGDCGRGWSL